MRYLGGKARIAKEITDLINNYVRQNQTYYEPFVGGCNIFPLIDAPKKVAADINQSIILFYQALAKGWVPPTYCSKEEYTLLKKAEPSPLKGFIGMSCGFGGVFMGTYAKDDKGRNYCLNGHNTAMKLQQQLNTSDTFIHGSYDILTYEPNSLIYCDPPYQDTTGYGGSKFDHDKFFAWARNMHEQGHTILLTEYTAPPEYRPLYQWHRKNALHHAKTATETLYILSND